MTHRPSPHPIAVVAAAIVRDGRCLAAQRSAAMAAPLRWELPGGKVEPGETPRAALRREIREELALEVEVGAFLGRGHGDAGGRPIVLDVYLATLRGGTLALREHAAARWLTAGELDTVAWSGADRPVLAALRRHLDAAKA